MLLEPDVARAVSARLRTEGYQLIQQLRAAQHGDDLVAVKRSGAGRELRVKVVGEPLSPPELGRSGRSLDASAVHILVADAFFKTAQIVSQPAANVEVRAAMALPDKPGHRAAVRQIEPVLNQLAIAVFWVKEDGTVQFQSSWTL